MPDEIVVANEIDISTQTTVVSWEPAGDLDYDSWYTVGLTLKTISKAMGWWIGDWLVYGERNFGESFSQAIDDHIGGIPTETLKKYKATATRVEKGRRLPELSWSHHFATIYLEPAVADKILAIAEEFQLSVRDVKFIVAMPRKDEFFEFVDTQIQLRHAEVMAEAQRLALPEPEIVAEDQDDDEYIPFADPPEEDNVDDEYGWLPDDEPMDCIEEFFLNAGLPIAYSDDTTVIWEGGISLRVQWGDNGSYLTWERTI